MSTSSAVLPENEIDRASRPAVGSSRVPWAPDRRTSEPSSSTDRAERSSSCGSMPIIRSTPLAVPLSTQISGRKSMVENRIGPTTVLAVASGSAMAMFLGTSSPNTMDSTVAMISASSVAGGARPRSPTARSSSSGPENSSASDGCITKPSSSVVRVMPTCAPDSWVDSDRRPIISDVGPGVAVGGLRG